MAKWPRGKGQTMSKFDLADFQANPGKYELFQTAQIATDQLIDFIRGEHVAIEYLFNAREDVQQGGAVIPVYRVISRQGNETHLYANAFMNFVL